MIESILYQPKGKTLEFKKEITNPVSFVRTLVAFANTAGGRLIVGVGDDHEIVGVERPLLEQERLASIIYESIELTLVPNFKMFTVEGKTLLIVDISLSGERPHFIEAEGEANGVYVRLGSTNRKANKELIEELERSTQCLSYDASPMEHLTIDDIDFESAEELLGYSVFKAPLITLRFVTYTHEKIVPTRAAILLFGKKRTSHFPDAWVQCYRFIGKDKSRIFDQTKLYNHLPILVNETMFFLEKHVMKTVDSSVIQNWDVLSTLLDILREVVINALIHTDYSQRGAPILVAFFDDRIEIENPGILLPGMTIDDIKNGISKIRNPVIAQIFSELSLVEQWGGGVKRILSQAKKLELREPEIVEFGMRLRFIVYFGGLINVETSNSDSDSDRTQDKAQDRAQEGTQWVSGEQDEQVRNILLACIKGEKSRRDILMYAGFSNANLNYKNYIIPLLDKGLLERTIPDKPTSRLQKYRLTDKGKEWLEVNGLLIDSIEQDE